MSNRERRRFYWELSNPEQAIVEYALPRDIIDRDEVVEALDDRFGESRLNEAFTSLKEENRFFRKGNQSEYIMVERDLF